MTRCPARGRGGGAAAGGGGDGGGGGVVSVGSDFKVLQIFRFLDFSDFPGFQIF